MSRLKQAIGRSQPYVDVQSPPIISQRAPVTTDTTYPKGFNWLDESVSPAVMYVYMGGGVWDTNNLSLSTDATFTGATNSTASSSLAVKTYADNLAIAGAPAWSTTISGIGELATDAEAVTGTASNLAIVPSSLTARLEAPGAIGGTTAAASTFTTLAATGAINFDAGGSFDSGGATIDIGADASADAINVGTGAAARVITIGNVTGASQVVVNSGTAGIALASTGAGDISINSDDTLLIDADGVLELNSSAGVIGIGSDADAFDINVGTGAAARTITVGNGTAATSLVLNCGTGALNIGTNAIAHTVTIGNKTGATAIVMDVGTGNFVLNGAAASTFTVGAAVTTGTIAIGGTAGTGTMTFGDSSGTNIVQIGSGEGATTVNIAGGATAAKVVNIATGAVANVVSIGSTTGASSLALKAGSGNVNVSGDLVLADVATQLQLNGGAVTDFIGQGTLVAGTVTIANTNIAATDRIFVTRSALNASPALGDFITTISAATSFTVASYDAVGSLENTDVSGFDYFIVRQN